MIKYLLGNDCVLEVVDVAVLDIVVISSQVKGAAVGHSKPGHLASLVTGISQTKVFKSSKVTPEFCQDTQLKL